MATGGHDPDLEGLTSDELRKRLVVSNNIANTHTHEFMHTVSLNVVVIIPAMHLVVFVWLLATTQERETTGEECAHH